MSTRLDDFLEHKDHLFGIAYRMLGSVAEAEDVVQEAYLRWEKAGEEARSSQAMLTSITTRLAIDRLRSAQRRRESYVGEFLPEPLVDEDPAAMAELADSLSLAFLVLLDRLGPVERAVFLLHDVLHYDFAEVASIVGKTEANCRQIASRARRRLGGERPASAAPEVEREMLHRFLVALGSGDVDSLLALMAPDVVLHSDGGAARRAARRPVVGPDRVARLLVNVSRKVSPRAETRIAVVNGQPGLVMSEEGEAQLALVLSTHDGAVDGVYIVLNPDKLRHVHLS